VLLCVCVWVRPQGEEGPKEGAVLFWGLLCCCVCVCVCGRSGDRKTLYRYRYIYYILLTVWVSIEKIKKDGVVGSGTATGVETMGRDGPLNSVASCPIVWSKTASSG